MKNGKYLLVLIFLTGLTGCDENESVHLTVDRYISLLKFDEYDSKRLPVFNAGAIPELLKYSAETEVITKFPRNPISSFHDPECKLGIFVLWTIESIRVTPADNVVEFPSQNPVLKYRDTGDLVPVSDTRSHELVAQAYRAWWEGNKNKDVEAAFTIDPLAGTEYQWR